MDDGGGNVGGSFRVKHGSNAAEVTDVHEAGAGEVGDCGWRMIDEDQK